MDSEYIRIFRRRGNHTFDIIAPCRKQSGDACQHTYPVQDRDHDGISFQFIRVHAFSPVMMSSMDLPAGTMGYTFSIIFTVNSIRTGPFILNPFFSTASTSEGWVARNPGTPLASATLTKSGRYW